ncbi:hypothetical protein GQ44DRAFT_828127 [Phaeosphaeriaceae sp. PMI808]|nr:hypothetical protein GQ44DRAFT_828127 [Phaeosphaeriaceae sp. PMI808]
MALEVGAAVVSFVGLASLLTQGLTFICEFTKTARNCPEELQDLKTDIKLIKEVIDRVKKQNDERNNRFSRVDTLDYAIDKARGCLSELHSTLQQFQVVKRPPHLKMFKFAVKADQLAKLQEKVHRFKTLMLDINKLMEDEIHANTNEIVHKTQDTIAEVAVNVCSTHMDIKYLRNGLDQTTTSLEKMTQSLTQLTLTTCGSPLPLVSPRKLPSTPLGNSFAGSRSESRDLSEVMPTSRSPSTCALELERFPLLKYQQDTFHLLVAFLFSSLCNMNNEKHAYERATRCLRAYDTPEAVSEATENDLRPYFIDKKGVLTDFRLRQIKILIGFAKTWTQDPPTPRAFKHKPKDLNFPKSEISHLPGVGPAALDTWILFGREAFYRKAGITLPKDAWQEVKNNGSKKSAKLAAYIEYLEKERIQLPKEVIDNATGA